MPAPTRSERTDLARAYLADLGRANNETVKKELWAALMQRYFGHEPEAARVLTAMALGAERTILNIPLADRTKRGRADTQYGTTIIEFEADLKRTGEHAREQLAEYLLGNWRSGERYAFTLITTDGQTWRLYAPRYEQVADAAVTAEALDLTLTDEFVLTDENAAQFYVFLDRALFRTEPVKPTLEQITRDFGDTSATFLTALGVLGRHYDAHHDDPALETAHREWSRFLKIAYGEFDDRQEVFLVHTYLSVFAKVIAYTVLTQDDYVDDGEWAGILSGRIFERLNVRGFVDRDFFGWTAEPHHLKALLPMLRELSRAVALYDFGEVDEDILKGVYQELIDLDTRHALGEYYTPDWLCERVVEAVDLTAESRILDPACGSGSFLRATLARLRRDFPHLTPDQLAERVCGLDIHPLSVQIAKTTVLLALGPGVRTLRRPLRLRVYLANTLRTPEGSLDFFGGRFKVEVAGRARSLPTSVLHDPAFFDAAVAVADRLAEQTLHTDAEAASETLANAIAKEAGQPVATAEEAEAYHALYRLFREAKRQGKDSIWKFIVQNLYKPFFLREQFDVVVGNPPWLTYGSVTVADYQDELRGLAKDYGLMVEKKNMPHLEIAAIFQSHAAETFLKRGGQMALVMPRSFFSADHHKRTRSGAAKGFRLTGLWDLDGVSNLFRVPACVLFSQRAVADRSRKQTDGLEWHGRLPEHNMTWAEAQEHVGSTSARYFLGHLGARTAFTRRKPKPKGADHNPYKSQFKQGATIVPRAAYFVQPTTPLPDLDDRVLEVETDPVTARLSKRPWQFTMRGRVHSDFLFRTAQAKSILPFVLFEPELVVLPVRHDGDAITLRTPDQLRQAGDLDAAAWFDRVQHTWLKNRTQRNAQLGMDSWDYLNWQQKLTQQRLAYPYLVLYNASAKDANAVLVRQGTHDRPFVVDYRAYWYGTHDEAEAYYLLGFLNATAPNLVIKDFQTRGLFGARDVSKTILEVPIPLYDGSAGQEAVAAAARRAEAEALAWAARVSATPLDERPNLGRLRRALRQHLRAEIDAVDAALAPLL